MNGEVGAVSCSRAHAAADASCMIRKSGLRRQQIDLHHLVTAPRPAATAGRTCPEGHVFSGASRAVSSGSRSVCVTFARGSGGEPRLRFALVLGQFENRRHAHLQRGRSVRHLAASHRQDFRRSITVEIAATTSSSRPGRMAVGDPDGPCTTPRRPAATPTSNSSRRSTRVRARGSRRGCRAPSAGPASAENPSPAGRGAVAVHPEASPAAPESAARTPRHGSAGPRARPTANRSAAPPGLVGRDMGLRVSVRATRRGRPAPRAGARPSRPLLSSFSQPARTTARSRS
ncbi:hypothetical protein SAMN02745121_05653 [Nannocystis exedens]|uniref:Uncharacterized protein n=1 Tax=Nannocystis exedens TaxID=54 RepID=A0A1I2DP79_9BACT|nr:hypothetical protein NAEX_02036 [Nannocystis exedens]SFE82268.1 hypothetical protein SAMN02745121_05653 [Nannocystis exedens]